MYAVEEYKRRLLQSFHGVPYKKNVVLPSGKRFRFHTVPVFDLAPSIAHHGCDLAVMSFSISQIVHDDTNQVTTWWCNLLRMPMPCWVACSSAGIRAVCFRAALLTAFTIWPSPHTITPPMSNCPPVTASFAGLHPASVCLCASPRCDHARRGAACTLCCVRVPTTPTGMPRSTHRLWGPRPRIHKAVSMDTVMYPASWKNAFCLQRFPSRLDVFQQRHPSHRCTVRVWKHWSSVAGAHWLLRSLVFMWISDETA